MKVLWLMIVLFPVSGCRERILHDVAEEEANSIVLLLEKRGIDAQKIANGTQFSIDVPKRRVAQALAEVSNHRSSQPPPIQDPIEEGEGWLATRDERQRRQERSIASRLENSLLQFPGVRTARVHLVLPQQATGTAQHESRRGSAGVLVVTNGERAVDPIPIQRLVSGAVGLDENAIRVVEVKWVDRAEPESSKREAGRQQPVKPAPRTDTGLFRTSVILLALLSIAAFSLGVLVLRMRAPARPRLRPL